MIYFYILQQTLNMFLLIIEILIQEKYIIYISISKSNNKKAIIPC